MADLSVGKSQAGLLNYTTQIFIESCQPVTSEVVVLLPVLKENLSNDNMQVAEGEENAM